MLHPTILSVTATTLINTIILLEQQNKIIQSCIGGNRFSQNMLYQQFAPKMFGVCLRYSINKEEAEEILQEGFVQVFKCLNNFKNQGSFEGWVRKIMVNCAIQHYRSNPKMNIVEYIEFVNDDKSTDEMIFSELQKKDLLKMVQALPPVYRLIFNLYVFEGMKHREIAELLNVSEGTSKSNLFNAKLILQKSVISSFKIAK